MSLGAVKAGHFEMSVTDPSPVWVRLLYRGEFLAQFRADELSDLRYLIEKATHEARLRLPREEREDIL